MTTLKERTKCPPNGFQFVQPETNWGEGQKWWDFEQLCRDLYSHRVANPRFKLNLDMEAIRHEVDTTNALRCLSIKGAELYVQQDQSTVPKSTAPHAPVHAVGGVAGSIGKIAGGTPTILDYFKNGGKPVDGYLANARAMTCARRSKDEKGNWIGCPKHGKGDWTRYFTEPAARAIKKAMEYKAKLKLSTPLDNELGVCEGCNCELTTKVHFPIDIIVRNMPAEVKSDLDPACWILNES